MTIAFQLFRENRVLDILYLKASMYTQPYIKPSMFKKSQEINFTFPDASELRLVRGSCGQLIHASLDI